MIEEKGSFRDPAGKIFYKENRVLRKVTRKGLKRIKFLNENGIIAKSIEKKLLINTIEYKSWNENKINSESLIFEHSKIPFISYPYEWSFSQLKTAAIHHLDFHLFLLELNATLIDSSAFNIQFIGSKPIFIDLLSLKKYEEGEHWIGHKQFCENFLNPLLLRSKKGINFNNWFKGNLEGISTSDLNQILSFFDKLSYNIFIQVYLLNKLEVRSKLKKNLNVNKKLKNKFPKKSFISMLKQLRNFIHSLSPKKSFSYWDSYSDVNTYKKNEEIKKIQCVENFCKKYKFKTIADLGCNDGFYSALALKNRCDYVVGFDYDLNSIEKAFQKSIREKLNFLPLYFDASNPSSNIGWNEKERKGFKDRAEFSGIIALAFEHHLAIAKNIPLEQVVEWLMNLAPRGLIEFVPKHDITINKMLELKGDIFPNYNEDNFRKVISQKGKILSTTKISESGRIIYEYER